MMWWQVDDVRLLLPFRGPGFGTNIRVGLNDRRK
jgi:hypothetical protein